MLADFQVTIPEFGTITARSIPRVVLTSNGTRELSDALRRRCLYHYVDYPSEDQETRILLARVPGIAVDARRPDRALRRAGAQGGPEEDAGRRRDARLGGGAGRARRRQIDAASETVLDSLMCLIKTREDQGNFAAKWPSA